MRFRNNFLLLILILFISCNNEKVGSQLKGIKKGGTREIVFSEDFLEVDLFFNHMKFDNPKVENLYEEGMKYVKAKDFINAKKLFLKAHQLEPDNPVILNSLGSVATEFQEYDSAIDYHQQAIALSDSVYTGAINNLGLVYIELEEYEKALDAYKKVLQNTNDRIIEAAAWFSITFSYLGMDSCQEAKKAFEEFEVRTRDIKNYSVLTDNLYLQVEACGEEVLKNTRKIVIEGLVYTISVEEIMVLNSRDSMEQVSFLKFQGQDPKGSINSRNFFKSDFQNELYTEFFNNASLTSTVIAGALNNRFYLITRLSRQDTSRYAEIHHTAEIRNNKVGNLSVKGVTYSQNEEKIRNTSNP